MICRGCYVLPRWKNSCCCCDTCHYTFGAKHDGMCTYYLPSDRQAEAHTMRARDVLHWTVAFWNPQAAGATSRETEDDIVKCVYCDKLPCWQNISCCCRRCGYTFGALHDYWCTQYLPDNEKCKSRTMRAWDVLHWQCTFSNTGSTSKEAEDGDGNREGNSRGSIESAPLTPEVD